MEIDFGGRESFVLLGSLLFLAMLIGAVAQGSSCSSYVVVNNPVDGSQFSSFSDLRSDLMAQGAISGAEDWHDLKEKADFQRRDIDGDESFEVLKSNCGDDPIPDW